MNGQVEKTGNESEPACETDYRAHPSISGADPLSQCEADENIDQENSQCDAREAWLLGRLGGHADIVADKTRY
jgi:hypothetical protein